MISTFLEARLTRAKATFCEWCSEIEIISPKKSENIETGTNLVSSKNLIFDNFLKNALISTQRFLHESNAE